MRMSPEKIYQRQNQAIHKGTASMGLSYTEYKEHWLNHLTQTLGRKIGSLTDLTLFERRRLIRVLQEDVTGLFNPRFPKAWDDWTKKDARKFKVVAASSGPVGEHAKRPIQVPGNKRPQLEKLGAILAELKLSWNYVDAIARKRFGVERVEWLDETDLRKVMQMMVYHQKRQQKREEA